MPQDKFYISSKNGTQITGSVLRSTQVERSKIANNKELNLLFDFFSKTSASVHKDIINGAAMSNIFRDFASAAGSDNVLSSAEIQKFLQDNNLAGKVSEKTVKEFLKNVGNVSILNALYEDLNKVGTDGSFSNHLKSIPAEEMNQVLKRFQKEYGVSLVQLIANESGSLGATRKKYLNIIRDKIMETKVTHTANKYKKEFDELVKKMDLTIFKEADATELAEYVNKNSYPRPKYPAPPKKSAAELEAFNKKVITQMMNDPNLCKITENKDKVLEKIMIYSKLNNPTNMVKEYLKDSNPTVREAAQNLLNSTFLDYFPLYVACIIAQESQFRETDAKVFSPNGQGVMQITKSLTKDIVERPKTFGEDFIKRLKNSGCDPQDSDKIYKTIQGTTAKEVRINYDVGTAGLKSKLATYFQQIKNGTYNDMEVDLTQPSVILEMMARNYNGNNHGKRDPKQLFIMSEVREVYARDVIERFRRYTPAEVFVRDYFQYNPKTKTYNIILD